MLAARPPFNPVLHAPPHSTDASLFLKSSARDVLGKKPARLTRSTSSRVRLYRSVVPVSGSRARKPIVDRFMEGCRILSGSLAELPPIQVTSWCRIAWSRVDRRDMKFLHEGTSKEKSHMVGIIPES